MAKISLTDTKSGYDLSSINSNFQKLQQELQDKVLYRDNPSGEPNQLEQDLDINGRRLLNVPFPTLSTDLVRLGDLPPTQIIGKTDTFTSVGVMKSSGRLKAGDYVNTVDYYSTQRGGGASYLIKTVAQAAADGDVIDGYGNHAIDGGLYVAILNDNIKAIASQYGLRVGQVDDALISTLSELGKTVIFDDGEFIVSKSINLSDNTIWEAKTPYQTIIKSNFTGKLVQTAGSTTVVGLIGIVFDGDFKSESLVEIADCEKAIVQKCISKNIVKTNDGTQNYRGAFMFLNIKHLIFGNLHAENIEQNVPAGFSHGQHHSFAFNDVEKIENTGGCSALNVDKLFFTFGTCTGDCGFFTGKDINDNVCYIEGTPKALIASFEAENYQEGIVVDMDAGETSVFIPYFKVKNGSSKTVALRKGSGLRVGKLISLGSRTGISDAGFSGTQGIQFDDVYLQDVSEEWGLYIQFSSVNINRLRCVGVDCTLFNEVIRVLDGGQVTIETVDIKSGTAATSIRLNELITGRFDLTRLITDRQNTIVYQSGVNWGGKVHIGQINGFTVNSGGESTITISNGVINILQSEHKVETEGGASSDGVDTINGAVHIGQKVTFRSASNTRDPVFIHSSGNIFLQGGANIRLNTTDAMLELTWNGTSWVDSLT